MFSAVVRAPHILVFCGGNKNIFFPKANYDNDDDDDGYPVLNRINIVLNIVGDDDDD